MHRFRLFFLRSTYPFHQSMHLGRAMLIDFDVSTFYDPVRKHRREVGTDGYMAPEVLNCLYTIAALIYFLKFFLCFLFFVKLLKAAKACKERKKAEKENRKATLAKIKNGAELCISVSIDLQLFAWSFSFHSTNLLVFMYKLMHLLSR